MKKYISLLFGIWLLFISTAFAQRDVSRDFKVKGFHLDLRIQVMKLPALKDFAKKLRDNGLNTLVMEWEATYPFKDHPLIPNRYAYTREEVVDFISYCDSLGLDVIPLQQSFGHVEYILRHYRYKDLREDQKDYSQVNPLREELNKELFTSLYKDLITTHTSDYIHIGGDETYLLGHSAESKKKVEAVGKGRLYGDYIKLLCDIVVSLGKRPVLWADIALKYPDALDGLPKETVFVDWNYGWDINMFGKHDNLLNSGFEIWGAPSIRSHPDNYFLTQWEKHFNNIRDFVPLARGFGYQGMVMTSWSTSGLYSPVWESTRDIVDLYTVRRVYPISGFNMLIEAYFKSVNNSAALDVHSFVTTYAKEQYGFDGKQATRFWEALRAIPYEINQGKISNENFEISAFLDSAQFVSKAFHELKPRKNVEEFEHYRLMADIRLQYLTYMSIELRTNEPGFQQKDIPSVLAELKAIDTAALDRRFAALNKYLLHDAEIAQENELRNSKISVLYERLARHTKH
ncbi:beta-N-acetylhexosaminidase [Sphingobacterium sp. Ka21]|uniref:Beta-N-acetylhexosaminidase n=2 Tax=Sphingobacterium pedocola TaxID=2082722 RepID=A0ABR9T805_9SPHI|nr:beta-N-acetylhexosaminidase [Sphingobacterium pedocola]